MIVDLLGAMSWDPGFKGVLVVVVGVSVLMGSVALILGTNSGARLGFLVALVAVQAKLERTPFDIPHAETEIVGGTFTEYSGKKLALFRLTFDIELVVASGLLAAVFLGGFPGGAAIGFVHFVVKTLVIVFLLSLIRALTSRIRVDQVVSFAWKVLAPLAVVQLLANILVKGFLS